MPQRILAELAIGIHDDNDVGRVEPQVSHTELKRIAFTTLCGISADTLRHYERKGLLAAPQRAANGYRVYPPAALQRVRVIQRALDMGFTLDDLTRVLRQRDAGGAPCGQVRAIAERRLEELDARIASLLDLRNGDALVV